VIAIFGSGFGLYGYLPALIAGCGQSIVLPERYRPRYQARTELARFSSAINWVQDENMALDKAVGAALILRPVDQEVWLERCLLKTELKYLLLEKPLARTPELAQYFLNELVRSNKIFKIGYLFKFTNWGRQLLSILSEKSYQGKLVIHWHFCAHHYANNLANWKRFDSMGGGVIRFFGIHVIALLAQLGYHEIADSKIFGMTIDETELWTATFIGKGLPECDVVIDTNSPFTKFEVICSRGTDCSPDFSKITSGPFDSEELTDNDPLIGLDSRTSILRELCNTLWEKPNGDLECYQKTLDLWRIIEDNSTFKLLDTDNIRPVFSPIAFL